MIARCCTLSIGSGLVSGFAPSSLGCGLQSAVATAGGFGLRLFPIPRSHEPARVCQDQGCQLSYRSEVVRQFLSPVADDPANHGGLICVGQRQTGIGQC